MSDHLSGKLILRDPLYGNRVDIPASADDRADIRRSLDLLELMGDDNDRLAVVDQVFHDPEKLIDLLLCQDRGGLIQNQDLCSAVEGLEDLDALLHADRNIPDELIRLNFQTVLLHDVQNILPRFSHVQADPVPGLGAEHDILGNCKILHQHEVLVYHTDAVFNGRGGIFDIDLFAVHKDLALIRLIKTVENVHQCTLTGAVLAEDRMDRSSLHIEIDVGQCIEGTEPLGDPMHLYSIFAADFCRHIYLLFGNAGRFRTRRAPRKGPAVWIIFTSEFPYKPQTPLCPPAERWFRA